MTLAARQRVGGEGRWVLLRVGQDSGRPEWGTGDPPEEWEDGGSLALSVVSRRFSDNGALDLRADELTPTRAAGSLVIWTKWDPTEDFSSLRLQYLRATNPRHVDPLLEHVVQCDPGKGQRWKLNGRLPTSILL